MAPVPLMHVHPLRLLLPALLLASLAGCGTTRSCGGNDEYLEARERPPLSVPQGAVITERASPLAIPPAAPDAAKLDPQPTCLDDPPQFFARKGAAADPAEEAVRAWAAAWADRNADALVRMYSPSFQAPDGGDPAEFFKNRSQQVTTGRTPTAKLDDVTVSAVGGDRRVVTFVQHFGDDAVRKELTLVREGPYWRIVAERTVEVL